MSYKQRIQKTYSDRGAVNVLSRKLNKSGLKDYAQFSYLYPKIDEEVGKKRLVIGGYMTQYFVSDWIPEEEKFTEKHIQDVLNDMIPSIVNRLGEKDAQEFKEKVVQT